MLDLSSFTAPKRQPFRAIFQGIQGIGKTSVAAYAPNAVIIPVEDGVPEGLPCKVAPRIENHAQFFQTLEFLWQAEHPFETVIIDSLDWLERVVVWPRTIEFHNATHNLNPDDPKAWKSIEQGYNAGFIEAAANVWPQVINALDCLVNDRGLNIIFTAHPVKFKVEPPDTDPYQTYGLGINKHARGIVRDWAWLVGHIQQEVTVTTKVEDKGFGQTKEHARGIATGSRVMYTQPRPAWEAKNRYSMPEKIILPDDDIQGSWNAIETAIRGEQTQTQEAA